MINNYPEVSKVEEIDGNKIIVSMLIKPECDLFKGHFEKTPVMPGIGQIDIAINMASKYFDIHKDRFNNIPVAKFKRAILPNDFLDLHLIKREGIIDFEYFIDNHQASSGRLKYA